MVFAAYDQPIRPYVIPALAVRAPPHRSGPVQVIVMEAKRDLLHYGP
jgi:hypothetical protein